VLIARRLMIVDDEESLLRALVRGLRRTFEIETYVRAEPAIAALRGGAPYGAILCDMNMPGIDGIEVYRAVLEHRPELVERFVFMSGHSIAATTIAVMDRSVALVAKPFDLDVIRDTLVRVCRMPC
jgi:DNA-binding NtrC family response regulator